MCLDHKMQLFTSAIKYICWLRLRLCCKLHAAKCREMTCSTLARAKTKCLHCAQLQAKNASVLILVVLLTVPRRYELLNTGTGKQEIKHMTSEEAKNENAFKVSAELCG